MVVVLLVLTGTLGLMGINQAINPFSPRSEVVPFIYCGGGGLIIVFFSIIAALSELGFFINASQIRIRENPPEEVLRITPGGRVILEGVEVGQSDRLIRGKKYVE